MFSTEHYDKVREMVSQGMTTREIVDAFPSQSDRLQVAAILSTQPDPNQLSRSRAGNRSLITFCLLMSLLGIVGLVDAYAEGKNWTPWVLSTAGDLGLVYGFVRQRLWAYAGFPLWVLLGLLNDLGVVRNPAQDVESGSDVTLAAFYGVSMIFVWIAYRIRRRVYPYAGFGGPRRSKGGQLAILADLECGNPSRAV